MSGPRVASGVALLVALGLAAPARGQPEEQAPAAAATEAEDAFRQGLAEMNQGHFDAGCPLLEKSHRLAPSELGVLFTLAECEWKRGRLATATARYGDFLQALTFLPPAQRAAQAERQRVAEEQRALIQPDVPRLTLVLPPSAPSGTAILLDGLAVVSPVDLEVDPGDHLVETRLPSGATRGQHVSIAKGERHKVLLLVPGSDAAASPSILDTSSTSIDLRPPPRPLRAAMWTTGAVGAAGLGAGIIAGVFTFAQASDARSHCVEHLCDQAGLDAVSSGRTAGAVSTIAFVVGGAGLGAFTLFYILDRRGSRALAADAATRRRAPLGDGTSLAIGLASPGRFALRGAF